MWTQGKYSENRLEGDSGKPRESCAVIDKGDRTVVDAGGKVKLSRQWKIVVVNRGEIVLLYRRGKHRGIVESERQGKTMGAKQWRRTVVVMIIPVYVGGCTSSCNLQGFRKARHCQSS